MISHNLDIAHARVIVCLDADILGSHLAGVHNARDFAEGRKAGADKMSRLYVAEAGYSLTGAAADYRLALPRKDIAALARAIRHEITGLVSGKPYQATDEPLRSSRGEGPVCPSRARHRDCRARAAGRSPRPRPRYELGPGG